MGCLWLIGGFLVVCGIWALFAMNGQYTGTAFGMICFGVLILALPVYLATMGKRH